MLGETWYFRADGTVRTAVTPETPAQADRLLCAIGYDKLGRGQEPTAAEAEALAKVRGRSHAEQPRLLPGLHAHLGYLQQEAPELLARLRSLAVEIGDAVGALEPTGWAIIRAQSMEGEAESLKALGSYDDRWAAVPATWTERAAAAAATLKQRIEANGDDGPEGWSLMPPAKPDHPIRPPRAAASGGN